MGPLRTGAIGLAVAAAVLATAGCSIVPFGGGGSQPRRIPTGGTFAVAPGKEVVVYGVRSKFCGMTPPDFTDASAEMFSRDGSQRPKVGEFYDAGLGQGDAPLCGGSVPVRAIGYRAPADFKGEVTMVFNGTDQALVAIGEPKPTTETESEPAPLAKPVAPPAPRVTPTVQTETTPRKRQEGN